jgi:hypothetical protein
MRLRNIFGFLALCILVAGGNGAVQEDRDHDGIADELGYRLANQFAPILFYEPDEPNLPTSVERFFRQTSLWFFSEDCRPQQVQLGRFEDSQIPEKALPSCRVPGELIASLGTRSRGKRYTFYLANVSERDKRGSLDTEQWVTYLHAYRNDLGGLTLQYWHFYPYNTGYFLGIRTWIGSHGGDWEAVHVVLNASSKPVTILLLGHRSIVTKPWNEVMAEGDHPLIRCDKGGHTTLLMTHRDLKHRRRFVEQHSWQGGTVHWPDGRVSKSGPLLNLGQKTSPKPGMEWLQYSGLWGTREKSGLYPTYRSGYWGPAFNETGMSEDGFLSAWCSGIALTDSDRRLHEECYAAKVVP